MGFANELLWLARVILQFTLIGAASIYYGDEAGIDGTIFTNEGCRYPMTWSRDFQKEETYRLYRTLAHLKADSKAFSDGEMKFLYAKGDIVAIARFYEDEIYTAVVYVSEKDQTICLPLGSVGSAGPKDQTDILGREQRRYQFHIQPMAKEEAVIMGKNYRFTVLTDCLIRMEYHKEGKFMDEPTQTVIYGDEIRNLRGTARTLDNADAAEGVFSASGANNGIVCQSKYMKGVYHKPKTYGVPGQYKMIDRGCEGCPAAYPQTNGSCRLDMGPFGLPLQPTWERENRDPNEEWIYNW